MILIDGAEQSTVDVRSRGLHYGDGVFETLAVIESQIRNQGRHWSRLQEGCQRLGLPVPDVDQIEKEVLQVSQNQTRTLVKVMIIRGGVRRGYRSEPAASAQRVVISYDWVEHPLHWSRQGIRLRLCQMRLSRNPRLAGIKHCNRLEQVLARQEWEDDFEEGLMQDERGDVIEGTMSNLFLTEGSTLTTPSLDQCGVAGIMRQKIIDEAPAHGIRVDIRPVGVDEVGAAKGLFVCNSTIGLWPVRHYESQEYALPEILPTLRELTGVTA